MNNEVALQHDWSVILCKIFIKYCSFDHSENLGNETASILTCINSSQITPIIPRMHLLLPLKLTADTNFTFAFSFVISAGNACSSNSLMLRMKVSDFENDLLDIKDVKLSFKISLLAL